MATTLLLRNQHILQSLNITTEGTAELSMARERSHSRPHSPVKLLTNLFGGAVNRDQHSPRKHTSISSNPFSDIPQLSPALAPAFDSRPSTKDGPGKTTVGVNSSRSAIDGLERLEATLASYILALNVRKGNIVGRTLRNRTAADLLAVNEVYNSLLENPESHEIPAQAPVDVLFAAFEKFVKVAWHDKMGPVIARQMWTSVQSRLDSMCPGDFEDVFRSSIADMAPQNQRAFRDIIGLLIDLLQGTSNDGDRGIMTASFAEVLAPEGSANELVPVLDRLVEDVDNIISEPSISAKATPYGSVSSESRAGASKPGSITSNTSSSLRKKFGLGLNRMTSKLQGDNETESGSVWRTLSKSKHAEHAKTSSLSKASVAINRSNSDTQDFRSSPKRPVSRDRPTILGAFSSDQNGSLTTIGENSVSGPPRKKRRSSVSDMRSLHASATNTPVFEPPATPAKTDLFEHKDSPRTPSPIKPSQIPAPNSSKLVTNTTLRGTSPARREGSPQRPLPRPLNVAKNDPSPPKHEEVIITAHSPTRRQNESSTSGIPTLKPAAGLSERPTAGNIRKLPPTPSSPNKASAEKYASVTVPPPKLRMQSPQKLRERLAAEQRAVQIADATLQDELNKIGEELRQLSDRTTPSTPHHSRNREAANTDTYSAGPKIATLDSRLATLTAKQSTLLSTLTSRLDSLAVDIGSSLQVSEARARALDALARDSAAENEALYAKFNEELARVVAHVNAGAGAEEVRKAAKEREEEAVRLRRENARLKREVLGLRAQLRGQ